MPTPGSEDGWNIDDGGEVDASEVIQSQMKWLQSNAGRINPATWPVDVELSPDFTYKAGSPLTYKDWIMCQDILTEKLNLPDNFCDLDPICEEEAAIKQMEDFYMKEENSGWPVACKPQAVWKKDNMWSPRRGHKAVVAGGWRENDKLYVMGGRAREYARFEGDRLIGGVIGPRVVTANDRITVREEAVLKNDIWVSKDGLGFEWELVNPGCEAHQRDVMLNFEKWTSFDPNQHENVGGNAPGKEVCNSDRDCYGIAVCVNLALNSAEKVCMCPMWSPREGHAVSVQHVFKRNSEAEGGNLVISEDYIYVVGGFINVRKSFCGDHACGTSGYRMYMDDVWVSNDGGSSWVQMMDAFESRKNKYVGRGLHAMAIISQPDLEKYNTTDVVLAPKQDQLWVFGGEARERKAGDADKEGGDNDATVYLNDVWYVDLPTEPCCVKNGNCEVVPHPLQESDKGGCLPDGSNWRNASTDAEWSGRAGHSVAVEPPGGTNENIQRVILIGGHDSDQVFDDVWSWGFQNPTYLTEPRDILYFHECPKAKGKYTCPWEKDYTPGQWYRTNTGLVGQSEEEGSQTNLKKIYYGPGHGAPGGDDPDGYMPTTPQQYYFYMGSDISDLGVKVQLPEPGPIPPMEPSDPNRYHLLTEEDVAQIRSVGINTLDDLLNADSKQILKIRGFDFPQVTDRLTVGDKICDVLELAKAIKEKCEVRQIQEYAMEHQLPKNVEPVFGPTAKVTPDAHFQWSGGGGAAIVTGKFTASQPLAVGMTAKSRNGTAVKYLWNRRTKNARRTAQWLPWRR